MVQKFGRVVVRAPWLVISAWVALVVVLAIAFPALTKIVENQTMQPLPPQAMAATQQMATDFGDSAQNILVVVMTDDHGLKPADDQTPTATLADKLRGDGQDVAAVQDFVSTPALRQLMVSKDNKAFYMAVTLKAPAGSPESSEAYQRVSQIIEQATAGSDLDNPRDGRGGGHRRHVDRQLPRYAIDRYRHGDHGHGHPAGDLPAAGHRVVATDHHRLLGRSGTRRGVCPYYGGAQRHCDRQSC